MFRREALLCGQMRGPSVWSDARLFCVVRREALLVIRREAHLCSQARGPSMWSGARPFYVVRRGVLLCGQVSTLESAPFDLCSNFETYDVIS